MKKYEKNKNGFTIIEVSLVFGIAGLIFLTVFLALPALQRSTRDSERREDITVFLRKVKDYQTANRGALPKDWDDFKNNYLGNDFEDPSGGAYELSVSNCTGNTVGEKCGNIQEEAIKIPTIQVLTQATCSEVDGVNTAVKSSNPRKIAVLYKLEISQIYCANS